VEKRAGAYVWTEPVGSSVDVQRLEQEGRAYVTAGAAEPINGSEETAMGLHLFDLRARKLMVTVSAMRDRAEAARAQALGTAQEIMTLSSGFGALLIAYLIWYPVLNRKPQPELQ
jgi:hypothetical protein